ncbi:hypothetical protein DL89DRAFT_259006 [Linderina pennispora]|uniref:ADF-H domain-containing protein n=1 Tax=Linderina pennispora TaxID=61395 RepID=A0A1Y1W2S0_9FUNG|nr:uncharacterized protein DL89DRAFT_259006 [Linderina pennispora]ORX67747.1 hypothetical protein DL89DRAFT_259006 [Linderina pennispora]
MSSLSSGIAAAPKLKQFLDESAEGQHSDISVLRVQIRGVDLVETGRKSGPANGDLTQLDELLGDDPAWYLVTWMPEGKVGVSNRMIYASSQSKLKAAVGFGNVEDSLQFSSKNEAFGKGISQGAESLSLQGSEPAPEKPAPAPKPVLASKPAPNPKPTSVAALSAPTATAQRLAGQAPPVVQPKPQGLGSSSGVFVKKLDPRLAMSHEQLQQMRTHFRTYTTPSKPDYDPNNQHANQSGLKQTVAAASGGFHTVSLPLSQSAKDALNNLVSDSSIAVVELQVEGGKSITVVRTYQSADSFSPCTAEPRFYVMNSQPHRVFIYSCPEGCAPRLRMVYSTATQRTLAQIQELGCQLTHKLSVFSAKECTSSSSSSRSGSVPAFTVRCRDHSLPWMRLPTRPGSGRRSLMSGRMPRRLRHSRRHRQRSHLRPYRQPNLSIPRRRRSRSVQQSQVQSQNDGVDSSPNTGAAAWGVQLKSGSHNGSPRPPVRGSAGVSPKQTPPPRSPKPETEIMHSSLPGLRHVSKGDQASKGNQVSTSEKQWDPWHPVSTVDDSVKSTAPESSLQSAVFTKEASTKESIPSLMGDITYPPLQDQDK